MIKIYIDHNLEYLSSMDNAWFLLYVSNIFLINNIAGIIKYIIVLIRLLKLIYIKIDTIKI